MGGWLCKRGWPKSINDPIFGTEEAENFDKLPTFGKNWPILTVLWHRKRRKKFFRPKYAKRPETLIIGPFDKWPTSNFRKSISDPTLGHPPPQIETWYPPLPPPILAEKIGGRLSEIVELQPTTVVVATQDLFVALQLKHLLKNFQ